MRWIVLIVFAVIGGEIIEKKLTNDAHAFISETCASERSDYMMTPGASVGTADALESGCIARREYQLSRAE